MQSLKLYYNFLPQSFTASPLAIENTPTLPNESCAAEEVEFLQLIVRVELVENVSAIC